MKMILINSCFIALILFASCRENSSTEQSTVVGNKNTTQVSAVSDAARNTLRLIIENVTTADGRRYDLKDNTGKNMDCLKVIANPAGGYIGVYHTMTNGAFKVNLATSTDVLNWTWRRELAGSGNGQASQPTIAAVAGGGFVMVWEQEPSNHLKFVYFTSWTNLLNGAVNKSYEAQRTLSNCAEGTPNIYSASSSSVDVGFHYYANCTVDKQARGTTNWSSWSASKQTNYDNALLHWGVQGNIGDRDYMNFLGYNYGSIEGQGIINDFGSWRCYLYDYQTGNADRVTVRTNGGSQAFANSTMTNLTINGRRAIVVTHFIPSQGAAAGEAGTLLYYKYY